MVRLLVGLIMSDYLDSTNADRVKFDPLNIEITHLALQIEIVGIQCLHNRHPTYII